jgi:hypothetical protein
MASKGAIAFASAPSPARRESETLPRCRPRNVDPGSHVVLKRARRPGLCPVRVVVTQVFVAAGLAIRARGSLASQA